MTALSKEKLSDLFSHKDFPTDGALHIEAQLWVNPSKEIIRQQGELSGGNK